jgi:ABC-type polysaccharide/polyol phosphate transport system ATPase subunit
MAEAAIEVHDVSKKFRRGELFDSLRDLVPALTRRIVAKSASEKLAEREFWALRDVSFALGRGEAFGIIGGNGAGKSTMLKLLTRIMRPTRGTIRVTGRLSALIEVSAGFHSDLTGRENVYLNGAILGMNREEIRQRFDAIVEFSGLHEFIDTPVKRYSSGMFARLGFSVAAHVDPDVLLVDEVLSVGDYVFQQKCLQRMHTVIASGATVIFVSHNLREVTALCGRSLLLEQGAVQAIGPTSEVVELYLDRCQQERSLDGDREIVITRVTTHDDSGPRTEFELDGKLYITVEAQARTRHPDVAVVIQIVDHHQYPIFVTCTERLGAGSFTLEAGETITCTFELVVALAQGTFHVNAFLQRWVTNQPYDRWTSAATFFVAATPTVRGIAMLRPRLAGCEIRRS